MTQWEKLGVQQKELECATVVSALRVFGWEWLIFNGLFLSIKHGQNCIDCLIKGIDQINLHFIIGRYVQFIIGKYMLVKNELD